MPNTLPRSVSASAGMRSAAAAATASSRRTIPSTIEYSLCRRRWTKLTCSSALMMYNFTRFDFTLWTPCRKSQIVAAASRLRSLRSSSRLARPCRRPTFRRAKYPPRRSSRRDLKRLRRPAPTHRPKSICRASLCRTGRVTPTAAPAPASWNKKMRHGSRAMANIAPVGSTETRCARSLENVC